MAQDGRGYGTEQAQMSKFWTQSSLGCVRTYYLRPALNFGPSATPLVCLVFSLTSPLYLQVMSTPRESKESTRNQATALLNFLVNCLWQEGKILIFSMACSPRSAPCHVESAQNKAQQKILAAGTQTPSPPPPSASPGRRRPCTAPARGEGGPGLT